MNKKHIKGWLKHGDFIVLDILVMQLSFILGYWARYGLENPYAKEAFREQSMVLLFCQIFVILFFNNYEGIIRRKKSDEFFAVLKYASSILLILLLYMFIRRQSTEMSRIMIGLVMAFFVFLSFFIRVANKARIFKSNKYSKSSIVLITSKALIPDAMQRLNSDDIYKNYFISGILILDGRGPEGLDDYGVPIYPLSDEALEELSHNWIDEVFVLQPDNMVLPQNLLYKLIEMGITVNYTMSSLIDERWPIVDLRKLGKFKVLSTGIAFATARELAIKRLVDIIGSVIGLIFTGLLTLIIGPMIYFKDPGPIFFSQVRIGKNGKKFNFFHFMLDLDQGPCAIKRLRGCGCGNDYVAITPDGDIFPCHQFVGIDEYKMGNIDEGTFNYEMKADFAKAHVYSKPECRKCWAKFYCSGGCNANNYQYMGDIRTAHKLSCQLEKKRLECAIMMKAIRIFGEQE